MYVLFIEWLAELVMITRKIQSVEVLFVVDFFLGI